jgi:hypothetical protein
MPAIWEGRVLPSLAAQLIYPCMITYIKALIVVHEEVLMPLRYFTGCVESCKANCGVGPDLILCSTGANIRYWYNLAGLQLFICGTTVMPGSKLVSWILKVGACPIAPPAGNDHNDAIDGRKQKIE